MRTALFIVLVTLLAVSVSAQMKQDQAPYPFLSIEVQAPDREDSMFVATAVREFLIRSGRAVQVAEHGDILTVQFTVEYKNTHYGYKGKYGNLSLAVASKNQKAAGTSSRIFESHWRDWYGSIRILAKEVAENFQYFEWRPTSKK